MIAQRDRLPSIPSDRAAPKSIRSWPTAAFRARSPGSGMTRVDLATSIGRLPGHCRHVHEETCTLKPHRVEGGGLPSSRQRSADRDRPTEIGRQRSKAWLKLGSERLAKGEARDGWC